MNNYAPFIPYKCRAKQKLVFVNFKNYSSVVHYYFNNPDTNIESLQYTSQNHDIMNDPYYENRSVL